MTDFVRFVFSIGAALCALLAGGLWLLTRPRSSAARRFIFVVIAAYAMAATYPFSHAVGRLLAHGYRPLAPSDVPPGPSAIVILGSGSFTAEDWSGGEFSISDPSDADRVVEAVRIYHIIHPDWIISSGGVVGSMNPHAPGGIVMLDNLVALGVPPSRVLVEIESKDTHDEAVIVAEMLKPLHVDHVVLVTSEIHMRRSIGTFRAVGLDAIPGIARQPLASAPWDIELIPSTMGLDQSSAVAHEIFGIAYYTLRGWYKARP